MRPAGADAPPKSVEVEGQDRGPELLDSDRRQSSLQSLVVRSLRREARRAGECWLKSALDP